MSGMRSCLALGLSVLMLAWSLGALGAETNAPPAADMPRVPSAETSVPPAATAPDLSKCVIESIAQLQGNRLAVLPFTYLDGSFSVEGRLIADELFMELAKSAKVELLEREELAKIVQEHKLSEAGLMDPATAPQLGKIAGVNAFVLGHLVDLGHKLQLTLRVVDTQSKVLAQQSFLLDKRIATPSTPLWEDIEKVKQNKKEQFKIQVWTDKTEYKVGDELVIKFKADRSCYVTIFNMGSSGQITVLFPNRFYATNYVKKDEEYAIPGKFQNFTIKAQGPAGIEKLKIFATEANVPLLPEQYNVSAFRSLDPKTEASVTRDLAVTIKGLDETAWAEGSFEFEVKEPALEQLIRKYDVADNSSAQSLADTVAPPAPGAAGPE